MNDAPDIRRTEATGYPRRVSWPRCPVCGEECEKIYKDAYGAVFGCENCVEAVDAWEWSEEE
jgi:hypothetical protein